MNIRTTLLLAFTAIFVFAAFLYWFFSRDCLPRDHCAKPSPDILEKIYVPDALSNTRRQWYADKKKPILDWLVQCNCNDSNTFEKDSLFFRNGRALADSLRALISNRGCSGMRIYFGSADYGLDDSLAEGMEAYKLILIFAPTRKGSIPGSNKDSGDYWVFKEDTGKLIAVSDSVVRLLVKSYQSTKQTALKSTLWVKDQLDTTKKETTSIFFDLETITGIVDEICYQSGKKELQKLGVELSVYSYTDSVITRKAEDGSTYELAKRLSLQFKLTDSSGKPLNMVEIDNERYEPIVKKLINSGSSYNTGNPTPPYPNHGSIQ